MWDFCDSNCWNDIVKENVVGMVAMVDWSAKACGDGWVMKVKEKKNGT